MTFPRTLGGALLALLLICSGCKDDVGAPADCLSATERSAVLEASGTRAANLLEALAGTLDALDGAVADLGREPSSASLSATHTALTEVYASYHAVEPYALLLDAPGIEPMRFDPFPVDTTVLNGHAAAGALPAPGDADFDRGLPALEYLLYGRSEEGVVDRFAADPGVRSLAAALIAELATGASDAASAWRDGGRETFVSATGSDAGSGLARLVNSVSKQYEDMRRDKLGLPFGVSLGFPSPGVLEAPYSGESLRYLRESIAASEAAVLGEGTAPSLGVYVETLGNPEGAGLASDLAAQYAAASSALDAVDDPLREAISDDRDDVQAAYNAISRQVVNLKTDVPALTCVAITYVDNPSDSD